MLLIMKMIVKFLLELQKEIFKYGKDQSAVFNTQNSIIKDLTLFGYQKISN